MLRVRTIHARAAGAAARYYTRYLNRSGPGGEEPGRWAGRGIDALDVAGEVETEDLEALLGGFHPTTGALLGRPLEDRYDKTGKLIRAVAGYDGTFSPPKSVSVAWAVTGDPGWLEAHDVAVRAVLDHVERYGCTTRARVGGRRQFPDARGLAMAVFRQSTSRADDPQIHTHVVFSAKVQDPAGRWYALDGRYLKRKQRALGGLYQSVLRAEITARYGAACGEIGEGQAEIAGVGDDLLDVFKTRTRQLEALLPVRVEAFREREGRDPTRWELAAITREASADSRPHKTDAPLDDLQDRWVDQAAEAGWDARRLTRSIGTAARDAVEPSAVSVEGVVQALSAGSSTWGRAEVLRAVCDVVRPHPGFDGPQWAAAVEAAVDQVLAVCEDLDPPEATVRRASDQRSVWLAPVEARYTHADVLAQEERILTFALDHQPDHPTPSDTVDVTGLDVMQADAARAVAGWDRLVQVIGPAGAGKTRTLDAATTDLTTHDRVVFGVAPTAKAARTLAAETGIEAVTVAKLLWEWDHRAPLPRFRLPEGATVLCDEAGMLSTGDLDRLIGLAERNRWRLVLVGDPRQLHAVGRGGMFDELCRTQRSYELARIHRFVHSWEAAATLRLRAGDPTVIDTYVARGRVTAGSFDEHAERIADAWITDTAAGRSVAVTAETNAHVDALNLAVQEARRVRGHLDVRTVVPIGGGESAAVGDWVVTRRNDRTLVTSGGEPVRNRERWQITATRPDGAVTLKRLAGTDVVDVPAAGVREDVRLGYAATAHGHLGDTVDVAHTIITSASRHRSLYVGATRGRAENHLAVAGSGDPDEAREILELAVANDRVDVPAVTMRRALAEQHRERAATGETLIAMARRALTLAEGRHAPFGEAVDAARADLDAARGEERQLRARYDKAGPIARRRLRGPLANAASAVSGAQHRYDEAVAAAGPTESAVSAAAEDLSAAETVRRIERLRERADRVAARAADPAGVEGPGLGLA